MAVISRSPLIPSGDTRGITLIAVGAFGGFLAIVSVILRIWAKRITKTALNWSDWCCFIGCVIALPTQLLCSTRSSSLSFLVYHSWVRPSAVSFAPNMTEILVVAVSNEVTAVVWGLGEDIWVVEETHPQDLVTLGKVLIFHGYLPQF